MHKMRRILLNPHFVAGQSHFCGSSIHLKVPTATVATSKICSMVSPMNSPSEVGPKWVCPRKRPKIQWWKTMWFLIKIAMFRYTPISEKNSSTICWLYFQSYPHHIPFPFLGTQTQVYPKSYRYKIPIKDPHKISPQQKSIRYFHHIVFSKRNV